MHLGKSYRVCEFVIWSRRNIYGLLALGVTPVLLYQVAGLKWLTLPLSVVTLLGTATTFVVGFKNAHTYARTVEAQKTWMSIASASRYWGAISHAHPRDTAHAEALIQRHLAWLTALRYQLRAPRPWETLDTRTNAEYRRRYVIPEREQAFATALRRHLAPAAVEALLRADSPAAQLLAAQGVAVRQLFEAGDVSAAELADFNARLRELTDLQGQAERIKDFPYPRQYAIINTLFVRSFCVLLPFGLTGQFDLIGQQLTGFMQAHMVWLALPFSVFISWIYTSLEQVGESTENPFEGGANDVPISRLCVQIERDLLQMQGRAELPALPGGDIAL